MRSYLYKLHLNSISLLVLLALAAPLFAQTDPITDLLMPDAEKATADDARVIEKESTAADDEKIQTRLSNIFSELPDLKQVEVAVSNSVVTLAGKTETANAKSRARALAMQVDGVVDVENDVEINTDVSLRVDTTINQFSATFKTFVAFLPMFLIALVVVILAWWLGRWVASRQSFFKRIAPNVFIADLLAKFGWFVIAMSGVIFALSLLDATSIIGTVLGAAGIMGLAVGFAVKDTVENYISSILLSLRNPFLVRDYVAIGDIEGSVARLTSRATILISADGNHIRIPNSTVFKATIINYTRNPQRRFSFDVGVDSNTSLSHVQHLALETLKQVPGVLQQPTGMALICELGDSSVTVTIKAWIDQRSHDIAKVRSEAIRQIKQAFDDAGIEMPEPAYRVLMQATQKSEEDPTSVSDQHKPEGKEGPAKPATVQDTRADSSVEKTLEEEIQNTDDENLLTDSAPHE